MSDIHSTNEEKQKNQNQIEKPQTVQDEEKVLAFWNENNIFEKSLKKNEGQEELVFYDGPPFATGLPHYGHILPGTIKDVIPRFQTMRGKNVVRKWGWDCHGLPIENIIEKNLNLNSRKDILDYGIGNFNRDCRNQVLAYKEAWEEIIPRTGRWVDMQDHYKTMDASYTESCWWAFKQLNEKGLVYKGYKPMHLCPRCETTLSNNEVAEGYEDVTDISVTAKFELAEEKGTYLLAWTTTPWTLPGNTAIAVGENVTYVQVKVTNEESSEQYIVAKARLEEVMKQAKVEEWNEVKEINGSELVGLSYIPPYDYYINNKDIENHGNGWKVWAASFVTDETGTGIAHEAPAYGADDYYLALENNIPIVHHVGSNGRFTEVVKDFAGLLVKEKDNHQSTDIEIIKNLAHAGLLFSKEKIVHSYPHCWRCKTPLINFATSSWFIKTTQLRQRMLEENNITNWVPDHLGHKRFHNWIENNVDWAVSRSRFWGAPLPVWENSATGEYEILGSLGEVKKKTRSTNNIIFIRHGESISNIEHKMSCKEGEKIDALTEEGKKQVVEAVPELKRLLKEEAFNKNEQGIHTVYSSPFNRTQETAAILCEELGIKEGCLVTDERLREKNFGDYCGQDAEKYFAATEETGSDFDFTTSFAGGESGLEVKKRMMEFLYEIDSKHEDENIVVVTHFSPYWVAFAGATGVDNGHTYNVRKNWGEMHNAKPRIIDFAPIPHNEDYELDLHLPYAGDIKWKNEKGEEYKLIEEVFDCWYESGSMPYASKHFMGEETKEEDKQEFKFPAEFICEAVDQTRGWFYSMLALGVGVFDKAPMQNVIVTGHVMAEDGKKMSKSLNNYPPLTELLDRTGADALRYFLLSSPVMRGEKVSLIEKEIDEVGRKIIMRLKNTLSFFEMYKDGYDPQLEAHDSPHVLDQWILSRLEEVKKQATEGLEGYELDKACTPYLDFVDDLSTWYVRRSRDRFKTGKDKKWAQATTAHVLREFSKILAPFMPFTAETLWQNLRVENEQISVHLEDWPELQKKSLLNKLVGDKNGSVVENMKVLRDTVTLALDARVKTGMKVRQPLAQLTLKQTKIEKFSELIEILKDELNVKEVLFNKEMEEEVKLNTTLTEELELEGTMRELVRLVQSERKTMKLSPQDEVALNVATNEFGKKAIEMHLEEVKNTVGATEIKFLELSGEEQELGTRGTPFGIEVKV